MKQQSEQNQLDLEFQQKQFDSTIFGKQSCRIKKSHWVRFF